MDGIRVNGARENNLKNLSVTIPRGKLTVFTGVSGSGKTTLAFDTVFAEGQRRYMESLSSYARMFLGQMEKPDVDSIEGLSPAVSIDQKTASRNPRSTVGTVTEIYDYLRILYARAGTPHCPVCGREIERRSVDQIADAVLSAADASDGRIVILAPVARGRKGAFKRELEDLRKAGYVRVRIDGKDLDLGTDIELDKNKPHDVLVTVDRLISKPGVLRRLSDSLEAALDLGDGLVAVETGGRETLYSSRYACPDCGASIDELEPRLFSFNSPFGACPECGGLGFRSEADLSKIIVDDTLGLGNGGLAVPAGWNLGSGEMTRAQIRELSKIMGFGMETPIRDLPPEVMKTVLYGTDRRIPMDCDGVSFKGRFLTRFDGVAGGLLRRYGESGSESAKAEMERYMVSVPCPVCGGKRLNKKALAVTVGGMNIADLCDLPVRDAHAFFGNLKLEGQKGAVAAGLIKEILARLRFLSDVGLGYLSLSRPAASLSGGEAQRIRLATQIGSGLAGVLYILDEPSVGLHQTDNGRLISALKGLRDLGNTLIVVEHDEETIRSADHIIDIGPGAGIHGGEIVAEGTVRDIMKEPRSITGKYLSGEWSIPVPSARKSPDGPCLVVKGARHHNLKGIDVRIPAGLFTAVTGVSGSGKSSLVDETVYPAVWNALNGDRRTVGACDAVLGTGNFDKIINIDQMPIGKTPRSNPATYTGVFTPIRELFAQTPDARARGYKAGRFSFNVPGGRCEHCGGGGIIRIEMHFLPDVYVPCEVCRGRRYNRETLEVKYKGKSIGDVLDMTVEEACAFFRNVPKVYPKLKTLHDVGLGYIRLGQPATTLSGGEAQRVKLAAELSRRSTGRTMYVLDEPTTGLHSWDVQKLIAILRRLTAAGNTVVVIEHNLDVVKCADTVIDLGPGGGDAGGELVACGTPEELAENPRSLTGQCLKKTLENKSTEA